ncbi:sigma-M negative effector [Priestia megaterium]|nr:sigma-M negative effector [Priestia megaterium]
MSCQDMKHQWEKNKNGTLTEEEIEALEEHTESCEKCMSHLQQLLEEEETNLSKSQSPPKHEVLDNKKVKRSIMMAKWKQRFSNVVTVLCTIILLWVCGSFLSMAYYFPFDKAAYINTVNKAAIESALPNVHVRGSSTETKPYFRLQSEYDLYKDIGQEQQAVGSFTFYNLFNRTTNIEKDFVNGQYDMKLSFAYPKQIQSQQNPSIYTEWSNDTWKALEKLPEGTVSEIAISFDDTYTLNEVHTKLDSLLTKDMRPSWYALDTGYEQRTANDDQPLLDLTSTFGFPYFLELSFYEKDGQQLNETDRVVKMMKLLAENERTVQQVRWMEKSKLKLKERYEFVKKNGVEVYGVVITGPTKELLTLKDDPSITYASLGEVKLWNWFMRPSSGTLN